MKPFLSFLFTLVLCTACYTNFEDGADFSFYTIRGRLAGDWYLRGVWINGIDSSGYSPYKELLGNLKFSYERKHSGDIFDVEVAGLSLTIGEGVSFIDNKVSKNINLSSSLTGNLINVGQINFENTTIQLLTCRKNRLVWESTKQTRFPNTRVKLLFLRK